MKNNKCAAENKYDKELVLLIHARCNCTICTSKKNKIKKEMGEKQFYKSCDEIKHSYAS